MSKFIIQPPLAIKSTLIAASLALTGLSQSAYATLVPISPELVYSTVSDVTWTKDGNLLGTLIAGSSDADGNGTVDVIDAIVSLNPSVSASDFASDGKTTWSGATAYVNYLNSINYGNSNQWRLPSLTELGQLHGELAGSYGSSTNFYNEQPDYPYYWSGNVYWDSSYMWFSNVVSGSGWFANWNSRLYTLAVTTGQISAVPEPQYAGMLAVGLILVGGAVRRRQQQV